MADKWDVRDELAHFGLGEWLFLALLSSAFCLIVTLIVLMARADGRADYCYVYGTTRDTGRTWQVEAHRPWRVDMSLGYFATPEEARAEAEKFKCRLHTVQP